jgi:hypothetical protein
MARYINDKTRRRPQDKLTEDRYEYLTVDQAEPNLGDPVFPGDTPPFGTQYITVSIEGYPGERYWIPNQGGIIPGSITIYDENVLVGGVSSTTQLNFIGAAISARSNQTFKETTLTLRDSETFSFNVGLAVTQLNSDASGVVKYSTTNSGIVTITNVTGSFTTNATDELYQDNVGIAKTPLSATSVINASVASEIEVSPEYFSSDKQLIFNNNDEFDGAVGFIYQNNDATESNVGLASVGIGTTFARRTLHVDGDIKLTGSIEDYNNSRGNLGDLLVKNNFGGIEWTDQRSVSVGAAGTIYEVQFHGATGYLNGADKLVYRSDLNGGQIGIGSTIPTKLLDVLGDSIFTGDVTFYGNSNVGAGESYNALWDTSENAFIVNDNAKFAAGTDSDLEIYHTGATGYIDNKTGHFYIRNSGSNDDSNIYIQARDGENSILCQDDGGVYLYWSGAGASQRAYTDIDGFRIAGRLIVSNSTSEFHGDVRFDGNTAGRDIYFDVSENSLYAYDNAQFRVGSGGDVRIYHDASNTYIEPKSDGVGDLIVGSATTDIAKFVYNGGVSLYYQDVLKFDTIGAGVTVYGTAILPQIKTVGVATIDNVQIGHSDNNTINTSSGNLILDSNAGTVQIDDVLHVNDTTESPNKDTGSIYTEGGVGIAKNLNVGGSVGIASTAESTSKDTGALIVEGGVGIEKNLNVGGSVKVTGIATITEKFYIGSGNTGITTILDEDDMVSNSDTALATQQSIKKYVDDQITAEDLDFSGDTGTGQVDLDSQTLAIQGTTNEIKTSASGQTLTIGFDDNVTINYLTSTNIKATGITTLGVTTLTDVTVQQLDVSGITTLGITTLTDTTTQQLFVSGISTLGNVFIQPIGTGASIGEKEPGVSGVVTFYGDGSGLRNVVAIGTGIDIQNSGTSVGSASTINFGNNLTGSLDAGVYTVNAADAPDVDVYWIKNNSGIHTLGNVGIGSVYPTEKLDVIGNAKFKKSEINFNDFCIIGNGTQEWYIPGYDNPLDARQLSPQVGTAITSNVNVTSWTRKTDAEIYDWCWDYYDYFDLDRDGVVSHYDVSLHLIASIRDFHRNVYYNNGTIAQWQDTLDDFGIFGTAYTGPTIPTGRSIVEHLTKWGSQPLGAGTSAVGVTTTVITGVTTGGVDDGTSLKYILSVGTGVAYTARQFIGPDDNIEIDTYDGSYQNFVSFSKFVSCGVRTDNLGATLGSNGEITDIYSNYPNYLGAMGIGYTTIGRSIPVTVVESGHSGTTASIGATVGIGGTLIFTINNGGTGYTNPEFIIPQEKNYSLYDPNGRYKYFTIESGNIAAQGDTVITGIGSTGEIFVGDVVMVDPSITNVIAVGSTGADPNLYARVTEIGTSSVTISKPALGATTGQDFIFSRGLVFYHYPRTQSYNFFNSKTLQIVGFSTEHGGIVYTNELPSSFHASSPDFGTYQYFLDSDTKIVGIGQSSITINKPTLNHREIPASQSFMFAGNGLTTPLDIVGRGSASYSTEILLLNRVFGTTKFALGSHISPSDIYFYEAEDWVAATDKNPSDGGAAQFRVNKTVGIGTTVVSDSETKVLEVYGKVSIADTTSNAGGARYISTEAPTAGVGQEGDIWYDVSSTADTAGTNGNIPVGGIIMWYGTIANIPASWALCDGTSYSTAIGTIVTPDLRDRFVVGAATTLTVNSTDYPATNITGTGTTIGGSKDSTLISHSHTYTLASGSQSSSIGAADSNPLGNQSTVSTSTEGSGTGSNENLPPYYALAYIMRIA